MKWLYAGLAATALAAVAAWTLCRTGWIQDLAPNVLTEALAILVTVAVVDRIVMRQRRQEAGGRVAQAMLALSGALYAIADFALWDYVEMHVNEGSYERPPPQLRALLLQFRGALGDRAPSSPRVLAGIESLSQQLQEQIARHERVLDHAFIVAAYRFMRSARSARSMFADEDGSHRHPEKWRADALAVAVTAVLDFLVVLEPYAREHLPPGRWPVEVEDDEIDATERLYRSDAEDAS
jgi:hypothetical protein